MGGAVAGILLLFTACDPAPQNQGLGQDGASCTSPAQCAGGFKCQSNSCTPTQYTCTGGTPQSGNPPGNMDVEFCTSCNAAGTMPDPSTNFCATEFPYACANGTAASGMTDMPNVQNCSACSSGYYRTSANACAAIASIWSTRTSGTNRPLYSIIYGNNRFVAIGENGAILDSTNDGLNWSTRTSGTTEFLYGIAYGNNRFVAVGNGFGNTILTSPGGTTWTSRRSGVFLNAIAYGNNRFVAVGNSGTILDSTNDGLNWISRTSGTSTNLDGIAYGNNTFVAVGGSSIGNIGIILTSPDGITWTTRRSSRSPISNITYGNNRFVAVGSSGTILDSTNDGLNWISRTSGTSTTLSGIAYANSTFVAVEASGIILTSPDGITWTTRRSSGQTLYDITYGNSRFVAVGASGTILSAP